MCIIIVIIIKTLAFSTLICTQFEICHKTASNKSKLTLLCFSVMSTVQNWPIPDISCL